MRGWLLAGVSAVALGAALSVREVRGRGKAQDARDIRGLLSKPVEKPMELLREAASHLQGGPNPREDFDRDAATRQFLLSFVLPAWLAAGVADWICHFSTDIEHTTGAKESIIHILMMLEAGVPIIAGLFLEITSPVLALMIASWVVHNFTALWDVSYATSARYVSPFEQHVHSYLEMIPLVAIALLGTLYWPNLAGMLGLGGHKPNWSIQLKRDKLPKGYAPIILGLTAILEWVPYLIEFARGLKENDGRLVPPAARAAQ